MLEGLVEDGFPLVVYAPQDDEALARLIELTVGLLRRGLLGVYGLPDDTRDLPSAEAEAILSDPSNWRDSPWFVATTRAGENALG